MAKQDEDDIDIDGAKSNDRTEGLPIGTFDCRVYNLERFTTGVDAAGKKIPGKVPGVAIAMRFDVIKVISQAKTPADAVGYDKEKASDYPPPSLVSEGQRRSWLCNPEHEQNRQRLRHCVQAALGFAPDSPEATAAKDDGGNPVSWNAELKSALGEENPLQDQVVRMSINRIVTQKGKGFAMYVPTFSVPPKSE